MGTFQFAFETWFRNWYQELPLVTAFQHRLDRPCRRFVTGQDGPAMVQRQLCDENRNQRGMVETVDYSLHFSTASTDPLGVSGCIQ
jgi:hypothetical protein